MRSATVRGMRWISGLTTALLLTACLQAGPGGCSQEEAAAFTEIDHFGDEALVPQDHPYGICGATFTSDADPDVIVEHYQTALKDAGWTVGEPETSAMTSEDGEQIGTGLSLTASKDPFTFSLGAELIEGGEPPTFNITVGLPTE